MCNDFGQPSYYEQYAKAKGSLSIHQRNKPRKSSVSTRAQYHHASGYYYVA